MIHPITVPKWGLSMERAVVRDWCVQVGQAIAAGAVLVDLETEKIANAVESPIAGTLRAIVAPTGVTVRIGDLLGVLSDSEVSNELIEAFVRDYKASHAELTDEPTSPIRSERMQLGSIEVAFQVSEAPSSFALPVLLLHGFGGDRSNWQFILPDIGAERTVYALDLPGHGESTKNIDAGSVNFFATTVGRFIEKLNHPRMHLVGHSLGAAIALSVASAQPSLAASVTLIAPAGLGGPVNQSFIDQFVGAETRREMQSALAMLVANRNIISKDFVEAMQRAKRIDGAAAALQLIAAANFGDSQQRFDGRSAFQNIQRSPLIILGTEDQILPNEGLQQLRHDIDLHRITGTGHMPHVEAPADVATLLARYLRMHDV
jgi:pyruvate dehydrogenase E2 component (dihydrolipoamide acetyltransferase)